MGPTKVEWNPVKTRGAEKTASPENLNRKP